MAISDLMQRLFTWKHEFEYRGEKFYQRIVPDSVLEDARKDALVASRKMRQALRDTSSDEYLIYIDPVHDLDRDELMNALVYSIGRETMIEYVRATPKPVIEAPSANATLEEQEIYEREIEKRDADYLEDVKARVADAEKVYRDRHANAPLEALVREYKRIETDRVCEIRFSSEFELQILAASLFLDPKFTKRAFTVAEFRELPEDARLFFRDQYNSINTDSDAVKN